MHEISEYQSVKLKYFPTSTTDFAYTNWQQKKKGLHRNLKQWKMMKLDTKVTGVKTGDVVKRKMKLKGGESVIWTETLAEVHDDQKSGEG